VLDHGRAGKLVAPSSPEELSAALVSLLDSPARRGAQGDLLRSFVQKRFNPDAVIHQITEIYDQVLASKN
jgi:glycosyltransferase involved in cell wall biosynthesis